MAAFIESFGTGEEELADPIERVVLAATMAERLVLHAASNLVDAAVRDAHHVERISDAGRVVEMRGQPGPETLGEIGGDDADAGEPCRIRLRGRVRWIV